MDRRAVFAWGMYDMANTIFSALFITYFYPFFVKEFLGGNEFQLGVMFGLSMLLVGLTVPFIGAWSDALGLRIPFVMFFTVVCCVATALISWSSLWWALALGLVANFSYHAALTAYNALLPHLTTDRLGYVSGIGVSMGYVGTILALGAAWPILGWLGWESLEGSQAMFVLTAVLFFVLSAFIWWGVKERRNRRKACIKYALSDVVKTLRSFRSEVLYFLVAMFLYANAITAVILFLFLYAKSSIGLSVQGFFLVYMLFSISSAVSGVFVGMRSDRLGPKRVLVECGIVWVGVVVLLMVHPAFWTFLVGGVVGGVALGAFWTANRPLLVKLAPKNKMGQFFGFMELTDKWSGVLGPVVFGWLVVESGYAAALASLLVFFALGLACLAKVGNKK